MDPESLRTLDRLIEAKDKNVTWLRSDIHGVVYRNIDEVQQKICASLL